jgi:aspartate aminotransferase-like enzyme
MPNAISTLHAIDPAALGLRRIGHAGAFRPQAVERLWPIFDEALRPVSAEDRS